MMVTTFPMKKSRTDRGVKYYNVGKMLVYKDNQCMAFNKPAGLAVQSKREIDLRQMVNSYANRRLWLLHRIDQPTSGLVLFGRTKRAAQEVSTQLENGEIAREYFAIVEKRPTLDSSVVTLHLTHDHRRNITQVAKVQSGKKAQLSYQYLASSDHYHLLSVSLNTGRHHQIRATMAHLGSPIKGDVKYGARRGHKDRSIGLHAYRMVFRHPVSKEAVELTATPPKDPLWNFFWPLFLQKESTER